MEQGDMATERSANPMLAPVAVPIELPVSPTPAAIAAAEHASSVPKVPLLGRFAASAVALAGMLLLVHGLPYTVGLTIVVVFVAATLSSIAGFAFSALCGAFLFQFVQPVEAVHLMIVCSIALQLLSVIALRNSIDWRLLSRFLLGGVTALPLGIYLLTVLDAGLYRQIIGAFLIAYGLFMLFRPALRVRFQRDWADVMVGAAGGITGGFAAFPGAFVTIWCSLKGWDKARQRGVYQPFILLMQLAALAILTIRAGGPIHGTTSVAALTPLIFVPAALLGTWCGLGWYRRLSDAHFAKVVNLLLIAAGFGLIL
jgi:uncharacterized membrane protein YfcA